ncbi:MAG: hypothetical protein B6D41_00305 [Chloroflexi bacterium UTCFX4]|jgi:serine/threonine-protein kinase|nr:MAG: hypothetical protein B6D41_00305 [Chloroflexi bacterium UTCFX4]
MLAINTILQNRYQILRLLGQGGMGAVYLAFDHRLNQNVALKENTGGDARQFQAEAELLARLRHPNLPRVIDHFIEPNGSQYLVMDYIEGEDLETLRQTRGALPEAQVRAWFEQILNAVAYLHSQGIIHRDIKPDNIKITPNGQAVLVDFGIAKIFQSGQYTRTSQKFGSPGYASPEHYHGGTNQQSDIYSLGATLYAIVTGGPPPDAQSLEIGTAMLVSPRNVNVAISPQMEQVILRAMRVKPNSLFASVQEMRQNLFVLTPTIPIPVPHPGNNKRLIAALGVGIVGMLITCGVGGWVWVENNPTATPPATRVIAHVRDTFTPKPSATILIESPTLTPVDVELTFDTKTPSFTSTSIMRPKATRTNIATPSRSNSIPTNALKIDTRTITTAPTFLSATETISSATAVPQFPISIDTIYPCFQSQGQDAYYEIVLHVLNSNAKPVSGLVFAVFSPDNRLLKDGAGREMVSLTNEGVGSVYGGSGSNCRADGWDKDSFNGKIDVGDVVRSGQQNLIVRFVRSTNDMFPISSDIKLDFPKPGRWWLFFHTN